MKVSHLIGAVAATLVCAVASDWPQWRGPHRDGHAAGEAVDLKKLAAPQAAWKISLGGGFSSPIIKDGRVYLLDLQDNKETARALDLKTGRELWKKSFAEGFGDEWGTGPRSTPFTDGERLYVQSCDGEFRCLAAQDGKDLWGFKFESYGAKFLGSKAREGTASRRGNSGSGVLDGDAVLIPVGAKDGAAIVCLNKVTGDLIWKGGNEEAAYSSLMVADLAGARQIIGFMGDALLSLDRVTGKQLWRVPLTTKAKRHAATPVIFGNHVMVNSHSFGTICYEVVREGSEIKALEKWKNSDLKINLATPVIIGQNFYCHGATRDFVSGNIHTGKLNWAAPGFGKEFSGTLLAENHLLTITDEGLLVVAAADPSQYKELLRTQITGKNWNYPALADGMLLVRDNRELACYPVR